MIDQLLARIDLADPLEYARSEVAELQFLAATERLHRAIDTIPVVASRAADTGTKQIRTLSDVVPLLWSDATYKSYPESFVSDGKWSSLGAWLDAISADSGAADVDVSGVADIDDWLARLGEAGHTVYVSSGTSGRCSMFRANA